MPQDVRCDLHVHGLTLHWIGPGSTSDVQTDSGFWTRAGVGDAPGRALPGTSAAPGGASVCLRRRRGPVPGEWSVGAPPDDFGASLSTSTERPGEHLLRFAHGPAFVVGESRVDVYAPADLGEAEIAWYLLGPVLSLLLARRGALVLHGTAAVPPGSDAAVAFVGASGVGKSTLGAALEAHGWRGVCDDLLVPLAPAAGTPRWTLQPGAPRRLLWPDTAERLAAPAPPNPCRWDKRAVAAHRWVTPRPVALSALFHLDPVDPGTPPAVDVLPPGRAVATLLAHLRHGRIDTLPAAANGPGADALPTDHRLPAADLDRVCRLVDAVPVRRLAVPRRFSALSTVIGRIEETLQDEAAALPRAAAGGRG